MSPRALFDLLPGGVLPILREVGRVVLRRPVVGIVALARRSDGDILLVQRSDTGTWALPGGTLEWGELAQASLERELMEEAGAKLISTGKLLGVYTAPERDARIHAVTMVVEAQVEPLLTGPLNPLEIFHARFFAPSELPRPLAYTFDEIVDRALAGGQPYWE